MAQSCLKIVRLNNLKNRVNRRILILRRFTRLLWSRIVACAPRKSRRYLLLSRAATPSPSVSRPQPPPIPSLDASGGEAVRRISVREHDNNHRRSDSDLVSLKISLLGDPEIGKTCFLAKYVGEDEEVEMRILDKGISCTDKMLSMGGARISYSIWELEGAERSRDLIPTACKDSVAILFMFDLTSRCTLNSVISWYQQARMSNQRMKRTKTSAKKNTQEAGSSQLEKQRPKKWDKSDTTHYNNMKKVAVPATQLACPETMTILGIKADIEGLFQNMGLGQLCNLKEPTYPELVRQFIASAYVTRPDDSHQEGFLAFVVHNPRSRFT